MNLRSFSPILLAVGLSAASLWLVARSAPAAPQGGGSIAYGQTITDTISAGGVITYTFTGVISDQVLIRAIDLPDVSGFETQITVRRSDNSQLCTNWSYTLLDFTCTLDASGTHTLVVNDLSNNATATIQIHLQRTNVAAGAVGLAYGDLVTGTLGLAPGVNAYTFSGVVSETVLLRLRDMSGTALYPQARVYRPDGTLRCGTFGDPYAELTCVLDATGTHTLLVGDYYGSTAGTYRLSMQRTSNVTNPPPVALAYGDTVSATLSATLETDVYTFSGAAGERMLIRLLDLPEVSNLEMQFWLYRPNGTVLCGSWSYTLAELACLLDASGTHTLLVGDLYGDLVGSYRLHLQRLNPPASAAPLAYGDLVTGTLGLAPGVNGYTFSGVVSETVLLRLRDVSGTALYPQVWVYRPDGTLRCGTIGDPYAELTCVLDTTGTHTLLVGDLYGSTAGTYRLNVQRTNNVTNPPPVGLAYGDVVSTTLGATLETDVYTFTGAPGEQALIRLLDLPDVSSLEMQFWLYRPNGTLVCSGWGYNRAELLCTLDAAGTYTLVVGDLYGDSLGAYRLYLQRTNPPANPPPTPIAYGSLVTGTVANPISSAAFSFNGAAGEPVLIRLLDVSGSAFFGEVTLYGPNGAQVCNTYGDPLAEGLCTLNANGVHVILVDDLYLVTPGSFRLFIQRVNNPANPPATLIGYGDVVDSALSTPPAATAFTFNAASGETIFLRALDVSATALGPLLRVYRPDGSLLCNNWGDPLVELQCTTNVAGPHTLLVMDINNASAGPFRLWLQRVTGPANPAATPIVYGSLVTASLPISVGMNTYSFSGAAGDAVLVRMLDTTGTAFYPLARIYRPDGTPICTLTYDPLADGLCVLTATGTHHLFAGDWYGASPGAYRLFLQRVNGPQNPPALPISFGDTVAGSLPVSPTLNTYSFNANGGDRLLIRLLDTSASTFYSGAFFAGRKSSARAARAENQQ